MRSGDILAAMDAHSSPATPCAAPGGRGTSDALATAYARWRKTVETELGGALFEKKLVTRTPEGIALQPLYTRADLAAVADLAAAPGAVPFRRGPRPFGYKENAWEFAQEIAAGSPAEFNRALLADLAGGQNSVVLPPSGSGPRLATVADFAAALDEVKLGLVPLHLRTGADPLPLAALCCAHVRSTGLAWTDLRGSVTADPLGALARGELAPAALPAHLDALVGWTRWAADFAPALRTIGVEARQWSDAGANAVQELAVALAAAVAYLREFAARGATPGAVAPRFRFDFAAGPVFFTEIAKFRAFRPLWTRVLAGFGLDPALAAAARLHVGTARWNRTLLDPHVNLLRATTAALSAVLGGCDALHIAPFDEVTGTTDDFSRRIARNVHTLLAEEFGFTQTADPAGGSWYVEKLTDDLARQAWTLFQDIERQGGYLAALESGALQKRVQAAAAEKTEALGKRRLVLVGTNLFPNLKETPLTHRHAPPLCPAASAPANVLLAPLAADAAWPVRFEAALSAAAAGADLDQLAALSPATTAARMAAATAPVAAVTPFRVAAGFEHLRAASDAWLRQKGKRPRVFLAKLGPVAQHKARADFAAGFFAVGGFEVLAKQAFETPEAAAEAAVASGAPIAVLCSTDETYPALVPAFAGAVQAAPAAGLTVLLAGLPADAAVVAAYRAAGIDDFIHVRANVHDFLATLLKKIGALS